VVDSLYPPGAAARIPVISVTGTNGKTTTTRMIAHVLGQAGMRVGMSCTEGVFVSGQLVFDADAAGPRSAEMVLDDPAVEAAVLETARGGIVRRGLGYDLADVAVITNISADHLGSDGVDTMDELINVKALVAEQVREGGALVLNADDPAVAAFADRPAVRARRPVIRYFSARMAAASPESDVSRTGNESASGSGRDLMARHKAAGGTCYEVIDGHLAETEGTETRPLIGIGELPGAFGGRAPHVVANALAASAACRAAGVSLKDIRQALLAFTPVEANPGRGNVFRAGRNPVIVDYGHNAAAMAATGQFVAEVFGSGGDAVAALTLPGDRRDDLVRQTAAELAARFGTLVLYEDSDKRGRQAGEMLALVRGAVTAARQDIVCEEAENPADALRAALRLAADGAPVLFVYEKIELARDALAAVGAEPWAGPTAEAGSGSGADSATTDAGAARTGNATQATASQGTAVGADAAAR
jgi:cyanophycin synthetase